MRGDPRFPFPRSPRGLAVLALVVFALGAGVGAAAVVVGGGDEQATFSRAPAPDAPDRGGGDAERTFLPPGTERSFARLEASTDGEIGLAVAPVGEGRVHALGELRSGVAWSTMKVPLVLAAMRDRDGYEGMSRAERDLVGSALTRSDNAAAERLFSDLEERHGGVDGASDAIERVLRDAGDTATAVNTKPDPRGFSTFGQTEWSAAADATFFRALARRCLNRETGGGEQAILDLMERVIPDQRWGLGQARFGTRVAFKGGWGPDGSGVYLVRQSGIVGEGASRYVVTILARGTARGAPSFEEGQALVSRTADWVARTFGEGQARPAVGCR